jgi:hypothetical protein
VHCRHSTHSTHTTHTHTYTRTHTHAHTHAHTHPSHPPPSFLLPRSRPACCLCSYCYTAILRVELNTWVGSVDGQHTYLPTGEIDFREVQRMQEQDFANWQRRDPERAREAGWVGSVFQNRGVKMNLRYSTLENSQIRGRHILAHIEYVYHKIGVN